MEGTPFPLFTREPVRTRILPSDYEFLPVLPPVLLPVLSWKLQTTKDRNGRKGGTEVQTADHAEYAEYGEKE